jgi:hypothetical protein
MYKAHRVLQSQCTPSIGERGSRRGHVSHGCFTPHLALRSFAGRLSLDGGSDYLDGANKSERLRMQVVGWSAPGDSSRWAFTVSERGIGRWLIQ